MRRNPSLFIDTLANITYSTTSEGYLMANIVGFI